MFVWVSLMFTFVDCVLGGCACNWDSRCDCVSSIFKLYLTCWWAWNLQRRPFVMTLANIAGDGLDHSQNCLIPIQSSPMNLGFRCLLDRSSLDCRQRQKGCRAWETMQRLKIAPKYVSYFVYVRIINVLDIDISMAFVIISIPGKTCQFSPIFFLLFLVEGFLRELLNLLWTNDFVTKKYAGIDEAKTKRGGSKQLLRFLWFLTNKGQGTQWVGRRLCTDKFGGKHCDRSFESLENSQILLKNGISHPRHYYVCNLMIFEWKRWTM